MKIPDQLKIPDFRFFLIGTNRKTPMEKRWNSTNNYCFFTPKLLNHINSGGNVGICTGFGNLIVIDFDVQSYQDRKQSLLPKTFTTRTAGRGLKHMYYILKGDMFRKIGIGVEVRYCDILAAGSGAVCPPSKIKTKSYEIIDSSPIAEIDPGTLSRVFNIRTFKGARARRDIKTEVQPKKIQNSINALIKVGTPRTNQRHFRCPFHKMNGGGNMYVFDDGSIFCFHCQIHFENAEDFIIHWSSINNGVVII